MKEKRKKQTRKRKKKHLFSMLVNEDIVDIEKPDGICSPTFAVDEFSGLFLHPSIHPKNKFFFTI